MTSFKDLKVWQKSSQFTKEIYVATAKFPREEAYGLTNQIRRAVVSISSNIAEGFARTHKKEKQQFYSIAYGSAAEVESQIAIAYTLSFLSKEESDSLSVSVQEIEKMIQGLMHALRRPSPAGSSSLLPFLPSSGFTLVELLVAIALFSIAISIAVSGFVNALRTQRQVASLISTQSNMTLVLEQMAREVRTGYLFCHDYGVNSADAGGSPSANCADPVTGAQCTVADSGQPANGAPSQDVYQGNGNGDLAVWTCPAVDYYNAAGAHVNYSLRAGALVKSDSSAADPTPQSITGNNVSVKYLRFMLFGNLEGDRWTPRVTISIGAAPSSTDPAVSGNVLDLQTTVSAREVDCDASGNC